MRVLKIAVITNLLFTVSLLFGQKDICINNVQRVYNNWSKQVEGARGGIYLKYNYEVELKNGEKLENNKLLIEVRSDKVNSIFNTKDLNVYQDKKNTVSVMNDKKLVVINSYVGDRYKEQKIHQIKLIKDTIFNFLITKECKEITYKGNTYKRVVLQSNSEGKKLFKVSTLEFLIDEKNNYIKQFKVKYIPGHRFHAMKMEILEQKLNYQLTNINREVVKNVLNNEGQLLSKYKGYQLIDNRN